MNVRIYIHVFMYVYMCIYLFTHLYMFFKSFVSNAQQNGDELALVIAGFAARELAVRIDHAEPKVIIAASCGLEPSKVVK